MGLEPTASRATIWRASQLRHTHHTFFFGEVVRQKGVEPPTHGLEGRCSILLSYWRITPNNLSIRLERVMGIEPTQSAWKAEILPLNYTRTFDLLNQRRS